MSRVFLVDEHGVYRAGLRSLILERIPQSEVIEARSLEQSAAEIRSRCQVDLVLIDVDLLNLRDQTPLRALCAAGPNAIFAIISDSDSRACILASLAAGLHGFISKRQSDNEIIAAINVLLTGRIYVPWILADDPRLLNRVNNDQKSEPIIDTELDLCKLSARQRQVMSCLARGMSNKEIARELSIAEATTKIHVAALLRGLGVRNRTEAAFAAGRRRLTGLPTRQ